MGKTVRMLTNRLVCVSCIFKAWTWAYNISFIWNVTLCMHPLLLCTLHVKRTIHVILCMQYDLGDIAWHKKLQCKDGMCSLKIFEND